MPRVFVTKRVLYHSIPQFIRTKFLLADETVGQTDGIKLLHKNLGQVETVGRASVVLSTFVSVMIDGPFLVCIH